MTRETQDLGVCLKCGWEWPLPSKASQIYASPRQGSRHDITKPPTLKCPFCESGRVKIVKELA